MSRFILVAMMVAVTVAGCNRFPDNGLQIVADLPPDSNCVVDPGQDLRLFRGRYDLSYRDPRNAEPRDYVVALKLESYLISTALEFQGEQGTLQVDNFDITLLLPDGSVPVLPEGLVNPYRVDTSAVLPVSDGSSTSTDVGLAIGIPASYQDALRAIMADTGFTSVLLDIRAGGTTAGGFSQRSGPFRWPVDLCEGCLDSCAALLENERSCIPGQDIWPYCTSIAPTSDDTTAPLP